MRARSQTVFGRLVLLMLGLLLASHALTFLLIQVSLDHPPGRAGGGPPPPPHWVWLGLVGQALVAAAAVWVGSRVLTRPFERLAAAAAEMQADHRLAPLPVEGPVEARRATALFNAMQQRIGEQVQQRQHLLAGIAHDLRGPLTRMQLRLEQPPSEVDLALLRRDCREMSALLEQSLTLLRGGVAAEPCEMLDLQALGQALVEDIAEQHALAEDRLLCLGEVPPVWARPQALRRALSNLLDNAVRHGGGGELLLQHRPGVWLIDVSDRGPGLADELLEQVLQPYAQGPATVRGGWGLGLAIAHQVAVAHGGSLCLLARDGGGLVVRMTLPDARSPG